MKQMKGCSTEFLIFSQLKAFNINERKTFHLNFIYVPKISYLYVALLKRKKNSVPAMSFLLKTQKFFKLETFTIKYLLTKNK